MATLRDPDPFAAEQDDPSGAVGADRLPEELLAPVVAGAFARGIADTFGLLGLPVLFLDREGRVLFASADANAAFAHRLMVRSGHLLAKSRKDNRAVAEFVAAALRDAGQRPAVRLAGSELALRALPVPRRTAGADQLLHAIVLIDDGRNPGLAGLVEG